MGSKRALLVTAFLALLVAMSGCQGGPSTSVPDETPTADELRQQTADAMEGVETASFTMDMKLDAGATSIEMTGDGKMDLPAKRMQMNLDMSLGDRSISATQYIDGNTAYIKVNDQWQRQNLAGQNIWASSQFGPTGETLEGAEIRINGTTVIDNRHAYRLEVEANETVARKLLQQSAGGAMGGSLENVEISGFSFTQYVDVETKQVRRIDMQMDMQVQGQPASADITMTFSNYNEDVNIQIPAEATG